MGDRANVVLKENDEQVCLYTHWDGTELPETVRRALVRGKSRWDDFQYLGRIVFCEMVKGREMELTGYGLSAVPHDGENRVIEIDVGAQTVRVGHGSAKTLQEFEDITEASWD